MGQLKRVYLISLLGSGQGINSNQGGGMGKYSKSYISTQQSPLSILACYSCPFLYSINLLVLICAFCEPYCTISLPIITSLCRPSQFCLHFTSTSYMSWFSAADNHLCTPAINTPITIKLCLSSKPPLLAKISCIQCTRNLSLTKWISFFMKYCLIFALFHFSNSICYFSLLQASHVNRNFSHHFPFNGFTLAIYFNTSLFFFTGLFHYD